MATRANRIQLRQLAYAHRAQHGCCDCGEADPFLLEHDHRDQETKVADATTLINRGDRAALLAELDKCDVRCRNCHRLRTADQLGMIAHQIYEEWMAAEALGWGRTLLLSWLAVGLPACAPRCSRCGEAKAPDEMKRDSGWCWPCHEEHHAEYRRQISAGREIGRKRTYTETHAECFGCGMRPRDDFGPNRRGPNPPSLCRSCDNRRKRAAANPELSRALRQESVLANSRYLFAVKAMMGCWDCQRLGRERNDPRYLEFHHLGPKTLGVGALVSRAFSRTRITAEIAQCIPLCSNCHKERTDTRPDWMIGLSSFERLARS